MSRETWSCPECALVYEVTVTRIGSNDYERHDCKICGHIFIDGKASKIYVPKLTKRGTIRKDESTNRDNAGE